MKTTIATMANKLISISERARETDDERPIEDYLNSRTPDEQAELLGLMWYGRDDDGPFTERVQDAKADLHAVAGYMAEKSLLLPDYLRNGLRLLEERNGG